MTPSPRRSHSRQNGSRQSTRPCSRRTRPISTPLRVRSTRARSIGFASTPSGWQAIEAQLRELAALPALDREIAAWTLPNGLEVSERRIPIGVVGANFEARPNVAVDVAGQLLKSLNGAVLRTGGAALRTVTALVDEVLRPALADAGLPPDVIGLVRSPDREGARALVSLPRRLAARDPARQRRDHGRACPPRRRARRPHARARRGRRRPLPGCLGRSGCGGDDDRRKPGQARGLQPAQPAPRRPCCGRRRCCRRSSLSSSGSGSSRAAPSRRREHAEMAPARLPSRARVGERRGPCRHRLGRRGRRP